MSEHTHTQRPRCRATVYDKYSEESRPCMRRVGMVEEASLHNIYCWQHAELLNRIYSGAQRQGVQG